MRVTCAFESGPNTVIYMKKITFFTLCALFMSLLSVAQTSNTETAGLIYFEFTELDFNKYTELYESVKADGHYVIETACIPAKVICVKPLDTRYSSIGFKQLADLVGLAASEWLADQPAKAFDDRCKNARTGN